MSDREAFEVRSFRVVFRLERRLHRIDRWRLPAPHGVPLIAVGYATSVLIAILALRQVPGVGAFIDALPAPVAYALAPGGIAGALHRLRIDGRPAHRHLLAQAARLARPACTAAHRHGAQPGRRLLIDDAALLARGAEHPVPAGVVRGPAHVELRATSRALAVGPLLLVRVDARRPLARPRHIRVANGQRARVRGARP